MIRIFIAQLFSAFVLDRRQYDVTKNKNSIESHQP